MAGYEVVHRRWLPEHGEIIPSGWRLAPALLAGLLWLAALSLLVLVPGSSIAAHRTVDTIAWAEVGAEFAGAGLLLAVAFALSVLGHGGRGAPRLVRATRWASWLVVVVLFLAAALVQANQHTCFFGCGPSA